MLFMIDTCQANTMYSKFYSPNIIATGSSEIDQSSYSHHADNDVPRQLVQNNSEGTSPAGAGRKALPVEVRFTDNSLLKLKLEDERLEFLTPYGRLLIEVADIHRIDFATRVSP